MNDINYIVNYLSMLKDDSISVSNLANEICTQICKDLGITRTDELEKTINGLLTRYKNGEINDNAIIQSFENMLNTSNVVQNNVSNSSYVNENISNVNNINKTFYKAKKDNVSNNNKESSTSSIIKEYVVNSNENNSNVSNDNKEDDTSSIIEEDVANSNENNSFANSNINSSVSLAYATVDKTVSNYDNSKKSIGEQILSNSNENNSFANSNINSSVSLAYATVDKTVSNYDNSKKSIGEQILSNVQEVNGNQGTNNSDAVVYDIDTDLISEIVNKCASVDSGISEASISVPGLVAKYASGVLAAAEGVKSIVSSLNGFKGILLGAIANAGESDIDYDGRSFEFSQIIELCNMYKKTGSKIREATADDFRKAGCNVVDNIVTITSDDGITYKYDISTNLLTDSNGNNLTVKYYLPESYKNISKLNTVTCLSGHGEKNVYGYQGTGNDFFLKDISSDAILVMPSKKGTAKITKNGETKTIEVTQINNVSYAYMIDDVEASTKFALAFSKQEKGCQNSIVGCSSGGCCAIKIAGHANGIYDNAVAINSAAIFEDVNKSVNFLDKHGHIDDNRITYAEAENLNQNKTNIVFISINGDGNFGDRKKGTDGKKSVIYNGLQRILELCPNCDTSFITNHTNQIYHDISQEKNYHYFGVDSEFWQKILNPSYYGHGDYHDAFRDFINSGLLT